MSMLKTKVSLNQNPTTPPVNLLKEKQLEFMDQVRLLHRNRPEGKAVDFHKSHLGKQHYIFKGSDCTYYVWERSLYSAENNNKHVGWRVFVNNKKGISFEVTLNCDEKDINLCWTDYLCSINMFGKLKP